MQIKLESFHSWAGLFEYRFFTNSGCPEAVPPKNGNVDATQGTATGDTVFYSCNDGYRLVGASSSVCLQDTTWSENDPVCLIGMYISFL